jgi:activator of HSP90 ATPase
MKRNATLSESLAGSTRRQFFTGMAAVLLSGGVIKKLKAEPSGSSGSTGSVPQEMKEIPATPANQHRTSLHQENEIKATPQRIYDALLSSKDFTKFSGLAAEIDPKVGGAFSMFGGLIIGVTVELIPGHRIVQAWRPAAWDPGVYSSARFELRPQGAGTLVVLDHTGFPEGKFDSLDFGWHEHYWEPLKKFLA